MATVKLENVTKSFGAIQVLKGISLNIEEGEFVALVGPSGCGKSTLLRAISGLDSVTSGTIKIDGRVVNDLGPRERNIAMVFQSYALYPHMTVAENIGFNLRISGVPKAEIDKRVAEVAEMLSLTALLNRKPAAMSGGQRQRVAMGRAIVRAPAAFLFDEPLSNLDAKLRVQMRTEIKLLHKKVPTTSVYVTHDQIEAMTLANRIVILNKGHIEQAGTPDELYKNPRNAFVGGFIGSPSMNFLKGTLERNGPEGRVTLENGGSLIVSSGRQLPQNKDVLIGLRPEHLTIGKSKNTIHTDVLTLEPTGAQNHLTLRVGSTSLTLVDNTLHPVQEGGQLDVSIDPANIFVFPGDQASMIGGSGH